MQQYEICYLVAQSKAAEKDALDAQIKTIIESTGGTYAGDALTFERRLAYKIQHEWRGIYTVQRFELPSRDERSAELSDDELPTNPIAEITRQLNLEKNLLRYIVVDATDLPPLADFAATLNEQTKEDKKVLKEKGEKIDGKLEKALNL